MTSLAKAIRAAADTEDHDLEGFGPDDCVELSEAAFKDPIPCTKMIRLTFTCGGGKKVRQKYSPDLPKFMCDALRGIGYTEDKGAALSLDCQGTFKYQHDTGKDLKYVHVFPRVEIQEEKDNSVRIGGYKVESMPPEIKCTMSEMDTFKDLVKSKCTSFTQKRCLLKAMKEVQAKFDEFEARMAELKQLTEDEQELYDAQVLMQEKLTYLSKEVQGMVDGGKLTKSEIVVLNLEFQDKIQKAEQAIAGAEGKKKTKLEAQRDALKDQAAKLKEVTPITHKKKNALEIIEIKAKIEKMKANMAALNSIQDAEAKIEKLKADQEGWYWKQVPEEDKKDHTAAKSKKK